MAAPPGGATALVCAAPLSCAACSGANCNTRDILRRDLSTYARSRVPCMDLLADNLERFRRRFRAAKLRPRLLRATSNDDDNGDKQSARPDDRRPRPPKTNHAELLIAIGRIELFPIAKTKISREKTMRARTPSTAAFLSFAGSTVCFLLLFAASSTPILLIISSANVNDSSARAKITRFSVVVTCAVAFLAALGGGGRNVGRVAQFLQTRARTCKVANESRAR